jgi:hypothetical protein
MSEEILELYLDLMSEPISLVTAEKLCLHLKALPENKRCQLMALMMVKPMTHSIEKRLFDMRKAKAI